MAPKAIKNIGSIDGINRIIKNKSSPTAIIEINKSVIAMIKQAR